MEIKKNLTSVNLRCAKERKIEFIVVHYTAGKSDYDGAAYDNTRYFKDTYRGASAHYFVDMSDIVWQCVEEKDIAWHVGDKNSNSANAPYNGLCTNSNSIGVEMVSYFKDGKYFISDKTLDNAAILCAQLIKKHGLNLNNLITHFDVTGKLCPMPWIENNTKNRFWNEFKDKVGRILMDEFKDIENHWAKEYIMKLKDYGIVSGDGEGNFRPDDMITRAETAKIVSNALLILGK